MWGIFKVVDFYVDYTIQEINPLGNFGIQVETFESYFSAKMWIELSYYPSLPIPLESTSCEFLQRLLLMYEFKPMKLKVKAEAILEQYYSEYMSNADLVAILKLRKIAFGYFSKIDFKRQMKTVGLQ